MTDKVSTMEVRQRIGDMLNRVALRHDEFIIERKGQPQAALVPVGKLRQFQQLARLRLQDALLVKGSALTQREADALADEAKHRTRKRKRRP